MFVCLLHMTSLPSKQLTTGSNNFVNNTIKTVKLFTNIFQYNVLKTIRDLFLVYLFVEYTPVNC